MLRKQKCRAAERSVDALVSALTPASPGETLHPALLLELCTAVRAEESELRLSFAALRARLRHSDSRTRLRALLLFNHLFRRARLFRELACSWLPVRVEHGSHTPL